MEPPLLREAAETGVRCLFGEVKALLDEDVRKHGSETLNRIFDQYYDYFEPYEGDALLARDGRAGPLSCAPGPCSSRTIRWFLTPFLPQPTFAWDATPKAARECVRSWAALSIATR